MGTDMGTQLPHGYLLSAVLLRPPRTIDFPYYFQRNRIIRFKKAPRRVFSRAELLHFIFTQFPFPAKNQFLPKVPRPQKETPHRAAPARLQQE